MDIQRMSEADRSSKSMHPMTGESPEMVKESFQRRRSGERSHPNYLTRA